MAHKIVSSEAAIAIIQDGDVLATTGYGGHGVPELLLADPRRFADGRFAGLEHETVFYDPDAFVQPVRDIRFFSRRSDLQAAPAFHLEHCNQTIFEGTDGSGSCAASLAVTRAAHAAGADATSEISVSETEGAATKATKASF